MKNRCALVFLLFLTACTDAPENRIAVKTWTGDEQAQMKVDLACVPEGSPVIGAFDDYYRMRHEALATWAQK